ncbi:MAG: FliM/FliN family flagellar motor switch protein [Gemmatimonadales bacterium]|nr:FliM/FliN family flagellar motor switch protein [Gemmatimonadales bacterium]
MDALSQKDIDSLLKGAVAAAPPTAGPEVIPYNFLRPPRISRDRRATIEGIHHRLCLSVQSLIASRTRIPADVTLGSVEQATFGEYVMSLQTPCAAFVFELGGGMQGVMDLGAELALWLVDRLFGGPGDGTGQLRGLTQLERQAVRGITDRILGYIGEVWMDHVAFEMTHLAFESSVDALQIASKEDNVLLANIDVRAGSFSSYFTLCLPLMALETFLQEKPAAVRSAARVNPFELAQGRQSIERNVRAATLPVAARFPQFHMRAADLASLRVGQVLHTGFALDVPLEVHVNGRRTFTGVPGQARGLMGVRVTGGCQPDTPVPAARGGRAKVV